MILELISTSAKITPAARRKVWVSIIATAPALANWPA
jgi:hypothetical protein